MKGEGNELDSSLWKASIAPGNDRIRGKRQGQEARAISLVLVLSLGAYLNSLRFDILICKVSARLSLESSPALKFYSLLMVLAHR